MSKVKCPNCKEILELRKLYDELLLEVLQCTSCDFKVSGFSFDFVSEAQEGDTEALEDVKYELGPGGMLVPYTEFPEVLEDTPGEDKDV